MFKISLLVNFIKNSFSELKKMEYPSKSDIYMYTTIVLTMLLVFGVSFVLIDKVIASIVAFFLK